MIHETNQSDINSEIIYSQWQWGFAEFTWTYFWVVFSFSVNIWQYYISRIALLIAQLV